MNSLNIITARVSPPSSPAPSRSNSLSALGITPVASEPEHRSHPMDYANAPASLAKDGDHHTLGASYPMTSEPDDFTLEPEQPDSLASHAAAADRDAAADERAPLLPSNGPCDLLTTAGADADAESYKSNCPRGSGWGLIPKRILNNIVNSIRWALSTLASPGVYLIACLYNENGEFAPVLQLRRLFRIRGGSTRKVVVDYREKGLVEAKAGAMSSEQPRLHRKGASDTGDGTGDGASDSKTSSRLVGSSGTSSSGLSSESESERERRAAGPLSCTDDGGESEDLGQTKRSIRIKLHGDDSMKRRKRRKAQSEPESAGTRGGRGARESSESLPAKDISAQLKSPTSPVGALTRYPRTPAPPRPLIPRRQPSYINLDVADRKHQKTLILDLDETLIHSMSKGGRSNAGHMVEVRLNTTYIAVGGQASIGPQHPILYFVHKRPHCDDFLRRVSKWFNLVVFTASVQEYADPVIDYLEMERKFFSARYYRQHCTFRHGAFIKDLSSVEPDLSKVMILDNSPPSYMFHQDNAIPIQGWVSDPTDHALMYLIPFLEGLQYISDVRALLALRGGEEGQQMA